MLPPLLPFRAKVVSAIAVTRGPVRLPPAMAVSGTPRAHAPAARVRGHRIELKGPLRVSSATLVVLGPKHQPASC